MLDNPDHLDQPVTDHMTTDFAAFRPGASVHDVLDEIRRTGLKERILYFYITTEDGKLQGVVPTRRILTAQPETRMDEIMISRVAALPSSATVFDACDLFITHKFLALPVVDKERRLLGLVEISLLTEDVFDAAERREADEVFQWIGVRLGQIRKAASPVMAFRYRAPWLVATLGSGLLCAAIAGFFEATIEQSLILAFFYAGALGLGESISIQSMTLSLENLRGRQTEALRHPAVRELLTCGLLGLAAGAIVAIAGYLWRRDPMVIAIGLSIWASVVAAGLIGFSIPYIIRRFNRDPQVAAGPLSLAIADGCTSLVYFGAGTIMLRILN